MVVSCIFSKTLSAFIFTRQIPRPRDIARSKLTARFEQEQDCLGRSTIFLSQLCDFSLATIMCSWISRKYKLNNNFAKHWSAVYRFSTSSALVLVMWSVLVALLRKPIFLISFYWLNNKVDQLFHQVNLARNKPFQFAISYNCYFTEARIIARSFYYW